jgi:TPR repeat protein
MATKRSEKKKKKPAPPASERQDDAGALFVLGIRYSTGRDVDQDLIAAHKWFNLAAMMGHDGARSCRGDLAKEMTPAQIAEAQRQARNWMKARDARHTNGAGAEPKPEAVPAAVARPLYVRRRAQAMRSAQSFARLCACA